MTMPLVLSLIGQRRRRRRRSQWPDLPTLQFVGGGFGGWYLPLSVSLSPSPTLSAKKAVRAEFADHKRNSGENVRYVRYRELGLTDGGPILTVVPPVNSIREWH